MATMYLISVILSMLLGNMVFVNSYDILKQHSSMYVDKTLFLEAFYTPARSHRCIYLTAPPGFGKTTITSMVDLFSGVVMDSSNVSFKPAFFTDTFKLFKETKVNPSANDMGAYLAKYMIVRMSVEYRPRVAKNIDLTPHYEVLQKMVASAAERYENFFNAVVDNMHPEDQSFLVSLSKTEIPASDVPFALRNLIKILHKYSQHSIVLLIDDHDRAAYGVTHKNSNVQTESFYRIFNTMIDYAAKLGPKYVYKALIMSTYSLPFYWSGETGRELEDFHHYAFLEEHVFTEFIGFTAKEVHDIASKHEWSFNEEFELSKFCNGYLTVHNRTKIYRPQCIENYIHSRLPAKISSESYDVDFRSTFRDLEHVKPYLKECDFEIHMLLLSYNKTISFPNFGVLGRAGVSLERFKELQSSERTNKSSSIAYRLMWNYLKEYGIVSRHRDSANHYRAPNQEVFHAIYEFVFRYHDESKFALNEISKCLQILATSHNDLSNELVKSAIQQLGTLLSYCDKNITGIYRKKTHEVLFKAILFASTLKTSWHYYSNHEVNYRPLGRCDMYLYNKHENVAAIVNIEYHGSLVVLPNIFTTQFPHPSIVYLTVLSINVKKYGHVEISHSVREVGPNSPRK